MASRARRRFFANVVLPQRVEIRLQEWIQESTSVNIFVAGKTGTGKTTLINSLVGREVSPEGGTLDPGTTEAYEYRCKFEDIIVNVWDTPGLQDGYGREDKYIGDIVRRWKKIDLFVYCIRMSETRFVTGNPDIVSMSRLNESLGSGIWKNALVILSFANDVVRMGEAKRLRGIPLEEYFEKRLAEWRKRIHVALHEEVGIPEDIAASIDVVPAGYHKRWELLPDGECWMSRLWLKALAACSSRAQPAFIRINEYRFKNVDEISFLKQRSAQLKFLHDRPLILAAKGEEIGAALGCAEGIGYKAGLKSGMNNNSNFTRDQLLIIYLAIKNKIFDSLEDPFSIRKASSVQSSLTGNFKASSGSIPICAFCSKHSDTLQTCGACKKAVYCNRECQRKDWNEHKKICLVGNLPAQLKICSGCEKKYSTLQSCRCHKVAYCSKECQRMDWYRHKTDCTEIK